MLVVPFTFAAGVVSWTLAEYLLHRFLGHDRRTWPNAFADEHTRHHSRNYFAPTWKKALVAVVALVLAMSLATLIVGAALVLIYSVAFAGMYATYEIVHRRVHTHRGLGSWGRYLRRHHFHHHFGNPRTNHGVTSPLWDVVFGTWEAPHRLRVPEKLCMPWLVDPDNGEVHPDLAPFYELVRASAS